MSWPLAVVLIVLMICTAKVLNNRYRIRHGILEDEHGNQSQIAHGSSNKDHEIQALRERVKVLERIATDPARRTAEEIEQLRDD